MGKQAGVPRNVSMIPFDAEISPQSRLSPIARYVNALPRPPLTLSLSPHAGRGNAIGQRANLPQDVPGEAPQLSLSPHAGRGPG